MQIPHVSGIVSIIEHNGQKLISFGANEGKAYFEIDFIYRNVGGWGSSSSSQDTIITDGEDFFHHIDMGYADEQFDPVPFVLAHAADLTSEQKSEIRQLVRQWVRGMQLA